MFRMLIHPSSGACVLFVELLHGLYCSGSMRVGVTLWFGWGGVVSRCRLSNSSACIQIPHHPSHCFSLHTDTTPPQPLLQPAYRYHTTPVTASACIQIPHHPSHCFSLHTDTTPPPAKPHRNTNTHRSIAIQPMK